MSNKLISSRLCALREKCGVSQDVVAESCNISRVALTRYENGQREPRMQIAAKLADYYGVSVDYILGRDDLPQEEQAGTKKDAQSVEFEKLWDRMSNKDRSFILHMMRKLDEENHQ